MDALQRETNALLRDLEDVEGNITQDAYFRIKATLKDLRDVPGLDETFMNEQVERLKGEVKRLVEQQNKIRAWRRVLETVEQNEELAAALKKALGKPPGQSEEEDEDAAVNVKAEAPQAVEMPDMETILGAKFAAVRAQTDVPLERSDLWVEFMERLGVRRRGDEDDELEVMQTQQDDRFALKCPITQMLFEEPVKNKNCQHTYSKAGILQSLRNKRQVHCPVPGCQAWVDKNSLVLDREKQFEVDRHKRQQGAN